MAHCCFNCQKELNIAHPMQVGRRETCPHCDADLHICLNCRHYDQGAYNQCKESQAERVLDKDRSNCCDYFCYREGRQGGGCAAREKDCSIKNLEALFKK